MIQVEIKTALVSVFDKCKPQFVYCNIFNCFEHDQQPRGLFFCDSGLDLKTLANSLLPRECRA